MISQNLQLRIKLKKLAELKTFKAFLKKGLKIPYDFYLDTMRYKKIAYIKKKQKNVSLYTSSFFYHYIYWNYFLLLLNNSNVLLNLFPVFYYYKKYIKFFKLVKPCFLNANINFYKTNKNKKRKNFLFLRLFRNVFLLPYGNLVSYLYKNNFKILIKYKLKKLLKNWFKFINKKEAYILNINNLSLYIRDIFKYVLDYKKKDIEANIYKVLLNKINFKLKNIKLYQRLIFYIFLIRFILKKYKINLLNKVIEFNKKLQEFSSFFFVIYKKYIKNYKIINKYYTNFSFFLKKTKKKQKKIKKVKNIFLKKRFNFLFFLNNIINKIIIFHYNYWINLFIQFLNSDVNFKQLKNFYFIFPTIYKLYYEKKKWYANMKLCFLKIFKPCKFFLYIKSNYIIKEDVST